MAERVLEKLDILDEQAKTLLATRAKKNCLQSQVKKKISVIPLTFDFQLELEKDIATSMSKTNSKITKDRSYGTKKPKRYVSFKNMPEPKKSDFQNSNLRPPFLPTNIKTQEIKSTESVEEYLKSRSIRSFHYLKDIPETEYAKPFQELYSQHRHQCRRTLCSTVFSSVPSIQSNAYKKEEDSIYRIESSDFNDFSTKENESIRNDQRNEYPVRQKHLLPLCFEDELIKPDAKIIDVSLVKTVTSHTGKNDTNPIIFHKAEYVQMLLLTKNRLPPHSMENGNGYPYERSNVVLERNCEMLKSVARDQSIIPSKTQRTLPTTQKKDTPAISFEASHRVVDDKLRKKTRKQTFENISWDKLCNFSQTFSILTKKFVGLLDKTVTQEMSAKTGKFEKMFSTVKPMSKFNASPVKYCSKPSRNILKVHKINNVTPLDDLLNLSTEK
ncbi:LOW QUALITY PROTEIN: uncharacterized protein C1orf141 homolog [Moschus berezovskii]|uniref:LOW QUALITY PROTEIN: uncharacterized protein C1orf141 homolog n=1 Tax=Moschus berezovskii TaxID=68408 RepID=UPI0024439D37|nr:LOW QUALITY PROTEIN: uncharacterized protein C1orf141 homolog [Moschus berezovskii]